MDAGRPTQQELMIGERIFHQHVKVDADAIGVSRNFNMNRVNILRIGVRTGSRSRNVSEARELLNRTGRSMLSGIHLDMRA